jgi:hypothetical protein
MLPKIQMFVIVPNVGGPQISSANPHIADLNNLLVSGPSTNGTLSGFAIC